MSSKGISVLIGSVSLFLMLATMVIVMGDAQSASSTPSKKVIIAVPSEPDTLDLNMSKLDGVSAPIAENITERLVGITPSGKLVPGLASSWKISPDGKELEFTLRRGIKFHSGDPLTSRDVEFSHNRGLKFCNTYQRKMRLLENFEIIDDYRVKFRFKSPDVVLLPSRVTPIGSKSYYDRVGEDTYVKHPIGTGPYKFVSWAPGQYIELKANEDYWDSVPSVKEVRFVFVKEDTVRVAKLKTGEADMIIDCPFPLVKEVESAGFKTVKVPVHPCTSLQFHSYNPNTPWFDRRVRQACAHAIDGDAIANRLFHGIPARYAGLAPWEVGHDPELKPYPYDPEKAKKLLAEAGYPKGFEMPLYYWVGRISGQKETTEAVVLYLNAIGIRCKVEGIEAVKFNEKIREWHKSSEAVFAGVTTAPLAHYAEPVEALEIAYYSGSAISLYRNPEFDTILGKARTMLDDSKRGELIKQAVRILHEDVAIVPIWANINVFAMGRNVDFAPTLKATHAMILIKDMRLKD